MSHLQQPGQPSPQNGNEVLQENPEQLTPPPVDATVTIKLLAQNMMASVVITPPENGGKPFDKQMFLDALRYSKIDRFKEEKIDEIVANPTYNSEIVFAKGKRAKKGIDASIEYLFETDITLRPKENEDGTVDYKELGLIQKVSENQLLVQKTALVEGVNGYDLLGNVFVAQRAKDVRIPGGKNTKVSEDGLQLLAAKDGHIEILGGKVAVLDTYNVAGDVGTATGNINFNGNVVINGSVLAGFNVTADGDIKIRGACEAAIIKASGSVVIGEGINGGSIDAGGEVKSKYFEYCDVKAGGSVYIGASINSKIKCGDSIVVKGGIGSILGGECVAANCIDSMIIGSENTYLSTYLEVGIDPEIQTRLEKAPIELEQKVQFLENVDRMISLLIQYKNAGRLDEDKAKQLQDAKFTRQVEGEKVTDLEEEIAQLREKTKFAGYGVIICKGKIFPGVRIKMGAFTRNVDDTLAFSRITLGDDGIVVSTA